MTRIDGLLTNTGAGRLVGDRRTVIRTAVGWAHLLRERPNHAGLCTVSKLSTVMFLPCTVVDNTGRYRACLTRKPINHIAARTRFWMAGIPSASRALTRRLPRNDAMTISQRRTDAYETISQPFARLGPSSSHRHGREHKQHTQTCTLGTGPMDDDGHKQRLQLTVCGLMHGRRDAGGCE